MALKFDWLLIDADDPHKLAKFWLELLDYEVEFDSAADPDSGPDDEAEVAIRSKDGSGVKLMFVEVHDEKVVKNRLHIDLRPDDQAAEVARAEALGAKRVDIGQGEQTWVVLADPEGNEFCILRAKSESD